MPALRGLRRGFTEARLVLATTPRVAALVPLVAAVDEVLVVDELAPLPWSSGPPELAVNLHGRGPQSTALLHALAPRRLVAWGDALAGVEGPGWRPDEHEVWRWCRLLVESGTVAPGCVDPTDLALASPAVAPAARDAVVVHPGAASVQRRWPADRFGAVAAALAADGHHVVVTGGPDEVPLADGVAALAGVPSLGGRLDVRGLAALVAHARLVVCGDTGVAHLATAYGTPSVVLFGAMDPALWGPPRRPQHVVLRAGGDAARLPAAQRLAAIPVAEVLDACRALSAAGRGARP